MVNYFDHDFDHDFELSFDPIFVSIFLLNLKIFLHSVGHVYRPGALQSTGLQNY